MGYVAHLVRVASVIEKISETNDIVKEQFEDNSEWL